MFNSNTKEILKNNSEGTWTYGKQPKQSKFVVGYKQSNKNPCFYKPVDNTMLYITIGILTLSTALVAFCIGYAVAYIDINQYYYLIFK